MAVHITWEPALAQRLREGLPLSVVGQVALPAPLSRLLVLGRSDRARMSLAAVLVPTAEGATVVLSPLGLGRHLGATRIPGDLAGRFASRPARGGGFFVLDTAADDQFLIAPGIFRQVTVTCGLWPGLRQLAGPQAPARPLSVAAAAAADLDRFCAVLEALLETMYDREQRPLPNLALALAPTRANVQTALGGLRSFGRGAANLLARLPTGSQPARVYRADWGAGDEPAGFADVGGQDAARAELETICLAVRQPDAFTAWGARPPRGVLLYGPPGTGKTLLARALAHESGARFLHVRTTDVVSKWYGEAEQRLQQAFDQARAEAPTVLFFDEIDGLARSRDVAHEATHRIISTLLENMDGLREAEGLVVLAATNRPEAVDDALLRPGRFDRLVEVPLPDREGRRAIFAVHMRRSERKAARRLFAPLTDPQWDELLDSTEGFSGADVAETVRRTLEAKVRSGRTAGEVAPGELLETAAGVGRPF
jgi:hypothetical protein